MQKNSSKAHKESVWKQKLDSAAENYFNRKDSEERRAKQADEQIQKLEEEEQRILAALKVTSAR